MRTAIFTAIFSTYSVLSIPQNRPALSVDFTPASSPLQTINTDTFKIRTMRSLLDPGNSGSDFLSRLTQQGVESIGRLVPNSSGSNPLSSLLQPGTLRNIVPNLGFNPIESIFQQGSKAVQEGGNIASALSRDLTNPVSSAVQSATSPLQNLLPSLGSNPLESIFQQGSKIVQEGGNIASALSRDLTNPVSSAVQSATSPLQNLLPSLGSNPLESIFQQGSKIVQGGGNIASTLSSTPSDLSNPVSSIIQSAASPLRSLLPNLTSNPLEPIFQFGSKIVQGGSNIASTLTSSNSGEPSNPVSSFLKSLTRPVRTLLPNLISNPLESIFQHGSKIVHGGAIASNSNPILSDQSNSVSSFLHSDKNPLKMLVSNFGPNPLESIFQHGSKIVQEGSNIASTLIHKPSDLSNRVSSLVQSSTNPLKNLVPNMGANPLDSIFQHGSKLVQEGGNIPVSSLGQFNANPVRNPVPNQESYPQQVSQTGNEAFNIVSTFTPQPSYQSNASPISNMGSFPQQVSQTGGKRGNYPMIPKPSDLSNSSPHINPVPNQGSNPQPVSHTGGKRGSIASPLIPKPSDLSNSLSHINPIPNLASNPQQVSQTGNEAFNIVSTFIPPSSPSPVSNIGPYPQQVPQTGGKRGNIASHFIPKPSDTSNSVSSQTNPVRQPVPNLGSNLQQGPQTGSEEGNYSSTPKSTSTSIPSFVQSATTPVPNEESNSLGFQEGSQTASTLTSTFAPPLI